MTDSTFSLFSEIVAYVKRTEREHQCLYRPGVKTHPIPFFGSIETAKVVTVGINPAVGEFSHNRYSENLADWELYSGLVTYFGSGKVPYPWFKKWEKPLSLLGYSYQQGTAVHLDLSPRVTESMRSCNPTDFLRMVEHDICWFWRILANRWPKLDGIFLAGSVTANSYIDELLLRLVPPQFRFDPPTTARLKGRGQVKWFTLTHAKRRLPVFFCSSGPSAGGSLLLERFRQNIGQFRDRGLCKPH